MSVRIETAPDLTVDHLAWIDETERAMDDLQRRIDEIDLHGWTSENWIDKVTPAVIVEAP